MANYSYGFTTPYGYAGQYGYAGSLGLAQIIYQTNLGDFVYDTDDNGNAVLSNFGTLGSTYNGLPYSGRAIELGATNDVDIPIHHTLGSDILQDQLEVNNGGGIIVLDGTGYNVSSDGTSGSTILPNLRLIGCVEGNTYQIVLNTTINSGACTDFRVYDGNSYVVTGQTVVNGEQIIEFTKGASSAFISYDGQQIFDITTVGTLKQITNPNSYVSYYDIDLGEFVTLNMAEV